MKGGEMMLLNKKQLAEKLNVSVMTIDRKMKEGLPFVKIGKSVRFEFDNVLDWFKNTARKEM